MRTGVASIVVPALVLLLAFIFASGAGLAAFGVVSASLDDEGVLGGERSEPIGQSPAPTVTVPSAPQSLTAAPGNSEILLGWIEPVSDHGGAITNYTIYRGTTSGTEAFLKKIGNVLTYTDTGLTNGQYYFYFVTATNGAGESDASNEASAMPSSLPTAPRDLAATPGDAHVTLSWAAPSSDGGSAITNYTVYRGTTSGGEARLATIGNLSIYIDSGLTNGQTYFYKVSANNSNGEGAQSDEASAKPVTVPSAPVLTSAVASDGQVALAWDAPLSDGGSAITNYSVLRGTSAGGETLLLSLGNVLYFTDTSVVNGQTYYYEVKAVNSVGDSAPSNELSATPATVPGAPQAPQAIAGDAWANVSWSAPPDDGGSAITNYQIWRGSSSGTETFFADAGLALWFNDTGLINGDTYYYLVRAENAVGLGPASGEASATPQRTLVVPSDPQDLVAVPGDSLVGLTWSAPDDDGGSPILGYCIYRGNESDGEALLVAVEDALSYTDMGLANGHTYFYFVCAVNSVGEGARSNAASATPSTVPGAPTLCTAAAGDASVTLSWMAPASDGGSAILNYTVYRGTSPGSETLVAVLGDVLEFVDSGLANGQTYYYMVAAANANGEGAPSDELSAIPFTIPSAPLGLMTLPGDSQAILNWTAPPDDGGSAITNYTVYRGDAPGDYTLIATLGDALNFTDTALTNGLTYYYVVKAANGAGEGPGSNEANVTPATVPGAPTDLSAIPGDSQAVLAWTAPSEDGGSAILNYTIYRGTSPGNETLLEMIGNILGYMDTGLTNGQTYYYLVRAVNSVSEGPPSNEAPATPVTLPSAPNGLAASPGDAHITLTWSAPLDDGGSPVTGYRLYRGTGYGTYLLLVALGDVLSYDNSGLANGQTYHYLVSAVNAVGEGPMSSSVSSVPIALPTVPRGLSAIAGNLLVTLNWTVPSYCGPGSLVYHLLRDGTEIWNGTATSHSDSPLAKGQPHSYQVAASNSLGMGPACAAVAAVVVGVPDAPWDLHGQPGSGQVSLSWSAANYTGPGLLKYHLFQDGRQVWEGTSASHVVAGLVNGETYQFKVAASNSVGWGLNSSALMASPEGPPSAPLGLHAQPGAGCVVLSWTAPAYAGPGPIAYHLYRDGTLIYSGEALTYEDTGADGSADHSYEVVAENPLGEGPQSPSILASPLPKSTSSPVTMVAILGFLALFSVLALAAFRRFPRRRQAASIGPVKDILCPRCGGTMALDAKACPNCGLGGVVHAEPRESR